MKERNLGLDLCRILSMLGIIILHIIGKGGVQHITNGVYTTNYWLAEWVNICGICCVDVFAIMSGYFGINKKKPSSYRAIELITVVLFFSIIITACFALFSPDKVSGIKDIIKGVFPSISHRYWYITNFIPIMLLQPYLNKMILAMSKKQHMMLCILSIIIFSVVPSSISVDIFRFYNGYSFVWLLCLYVIGAYLKRSVLDTYKLSRKLLFLTFISVSIMLLFGNIFIDYVIGLNHKYFVKYTSPFILLMGICAFLLLKNMKFKKGAKPLEMLSNVAFDVYIVHCHIFIYDFIIDDAFEWIANAPSYLIIPIILACGTAIYAACAIIGILRIKLFKITRLSNLLLKISEFIDKLIYIDFSSPCENTNT